MTTRGALRIQRPFVETDSPSQRAGVELPVFRGEGSEDWLRSVEQDESGRKVRKERHASTAHPYSEYRKDSRWKEDLGNSRIANQCPRIHRPDSEPFWSGSWRVRCGRLPRSTYSRAASEECSKSRDGARRSKPRILSRDFRMGSRESSIFESAGILQAPKGSGHLGQATAADRTSCQAGGIAWQIVRLDSLPRSSIRLEFDKRLSPWTIEASKICAAPTRRGACCWRTTRPW